MLDDGEVTDGSGGHPARDVDDRLLGLGRDQPRRGDVDRPDLVGVGTVGDGAHNVTFGHHRDRPVGRLDERDTDVELGEHRGERPQRELLAHRDHVARHDLPDLAARIRHHRHLSSWDVERGAVGGRRGRGQGPEPQKDRSRAEGPWPTAGDGQNLVGQARVRKHPMATIDRPPGIEGAVSTGYEPVLDAFVENFTQRGEVGAACCIFRDGEPVVDLWGGVRDAVSGDPWRADTMVLVHSTTKGLAAMVLALANSRGWLDYDERVCSYWPEFAQAGKETITVRQLLAHQAGLFAFDERVDRDIVADPCRLAEVMARQRPAWPPGERQAYHAISLGFYESELVHRIDPEHRSLGRCFAEEIARPLGLDFFIGTPDSIADDRFAPLEPPTVWKRLTGMPLSITLAAMNHRSVLYRALIANPGTGFYVDHGRIVRNLEVPSGGGVGSARAIATAYGVFADGGHELGLGRRRSPRSRRPPSRRATASTMSSSAARPSSPSVSCDRATACHSATKAPTARQGRAARWATPTRGCGSGTAT